MLIQEITTIHLSLKFLCFSSVLFNNKLFHNTVQYQYTITFPQITNLKSFNLWIGNYLCLATTVQYFVLYTEQKSVLLMADSSLSLMSQCKARFLQDYVSINLNSFSPSGNPQAFDCCPCPGSWVFDTKSLLRVENLNPVKGGKSEPKEFEIYRRGDISFFLILDRVPSQATRTSGLSHRMFFL